VVKGAIFHYYTSDDYLPMLELTKARHQAYADKWDFDLIAMDIRKLDKQGKNNSSNIINFLGYLLRSYEYVVRLDIDTLIWDMETDLRTATDEIGAVLYQANRPVPQGNLYMHKFGGKSWHFNIGAVYVKRSDFTVAFIKEWADLTRAFNSTYGSQNAFNILALKYEVAPLDCRWNYTRNRHGECLDPVVMGYHGYPGHSLKKEMMLSDLERLKV